MAYSKKSSGSSIPLEPARCRVVGCEERTSSRYFYQPSYGVLAVAGWCSCMEKVIGKVAFQDWQAVYPSDLPEDIRPKWDPPFHGIYTDCPVYRTRIMHVYRWLPDGSFMRWRHGAGLCQCHPEAKLPAAEIEVQWKNFMATNKGLLIEAMKPTTVDETREAAREAVEDAEAGPEA